MDSMIIKKWIVQACIENNVPELKNKIQYRFRKKFTRIFGQAVYPYLIELSAPLWERATFQQQKQGVIHETCHLIAEHKYGRKIKAHGPQWMECMLLAGYPKPDKRHSISREGIKKYYPRYEAKCICTNMWVGHNSVTRIKSKEIVCNNCGTKVKLTGKSYRPET